MKGQQRGWGQAYIPYVESFSGALSNNQKESKDKGIIKKKKKITLTVNAVGIKLNSS